jgi:hypothetical protein
LISLSILKTSYYQTVIRFLARRWVITHSFRIDADKIATKAVRHEAGKSSSISVCSVGKKTVQSSKNGGDTRSRPSMRRLVKKRTTWRELVLDPEECHASIRTL